MEKSSTFSAPFKRSLFTQDTKYFAPGYPSESKPQELTISMISIPELAQMAHTLLKELNLQSHKVPVTGIKYLIIMIVI